MTTSGTTAFSQTARELVTDALDECAILPLGDEPTGPEMAKCIKRLNAMLKSWQMQGMQWKQETITVVTTASVGSVALPDYVREVNAARYVMSATNERDMARYERDDFNILPNKTAPGVATIYSISRDASGLTLHVWPVPMSPASIRLDIDRAMDMVTDPAQTVDIPTELTETVYTALAVRCAGIFGQEPGAELVARSQYLERLMLDTYRPASYFMAAC